MALLFWERMNWTRQHFRQIVGSFQAKAGSHCSGDLRQWDLFNGLVWCAAECSALGMKSWLCHVNPKEVAAWSLVAPGAEEASRHAPGTGGSLYSLDPSGERSQCWPLTPFLGGETQHMKGTEETPLLMEVWNTWRLLPAAPKRVQRSRELVSLEQEEIKLWEQEQDRACAVVCLKRCESWLQKKRSLEKMPVSAIQTVPLNTSRKADKQQASLPVFWHYFLVSSSLCFFTSLLIEVWFEIYTVLCYSNSKQTLDCFMSWNCSEITAWKPWMCISSKDIFKMIVL